MTIPAFTGLVLCALLTLCRAASVELGNTTVIGRDLTTLNQEHFAGIPFAEPPIGQLRLRPPVPKYTLNGTTFNATNYRLGCIQQIKTEGASYSEDCLHLSILRPAGLADGVKLPVMTWIYGGGFVGGDSSTANGSAIVAESVARGTPIVYVNLNYRLGPLGFPQGAEAAQQGVLNLGLKDQLAALGWIQHNIEYWGGDKSKVTVFGQSAGAISLAIQMLRPEFSSYARALILESGSAGSVGPNLPTTPQKEASWASFVSTIPGCAGDNSTSAFDCLRTAPLNDTQWIAATSTVLNQSSASLAFSPVFDGEDGVFPAPASEILASGKWSKLPFIAGTNKDEGTFFTDPTATWTAPGIAASLYAHFTPPLPGVSDSSVNASTMRLLELYPDAPSLGSPFGTGNETFGLDPEFKRVAAIGTDTAFCGPRRGLTRSAAAQGIATYAYLFTDPQPPSIFPALYGTTHSAEIAYVYGNCASRDAATQALCRNMIDYWVSFVTSLNPNDGKGSTRVTWNRYNTTDDQAVLRLNGANTTMIPDTFREAQINYIIDNSLVFHL